MGLVVLGADMNGDGRGETLAAHAKGDLWEFNWRSGGMRWHPCLVRPALAAIRCPPLGPWTIVLCPAVPCVVANGTLWLFGGKSQVRLPGRRQVGKEASYS